MTPARKEHLKRLLEMNSIPRCWAIVRHTYMGKRFIREEVMVFHSRKVARNHYKRLINDPHNGLTPKNLSLRARRLKFGEGMYK